MQRTRTYECMCLLDNREVRKGWQPVKDTVAAVFSKHGAELLSARRWDERRLAFQIKGQQRATYLLSYVKADTQQLVGIRRDLQFSDAVIRSLITACDEVPASAYEPEAEFDVNAIPVDDSLVASSTEASAEEESGDEGASGAAEAKAEGGSGAKDDGDGEKTDESADEPVEAAADGDETKEDDR